MGGLPAGSSAHKQPAPSCRQADTRRAPVCSHLRYLATQSLDSMRTEFRNSSLLGASRSSSTAARMSLIMLDCKGQDAPVACGQRSPAQRQLRL